MSDHLSDLALAEIAAGEPAGGGSHHEHIEACASCRTRLASTREVMRLLGELPAPAPAPASLGRLLARRLADGPAGAQRRAAAHVAGGAAGQERRGAALRWALRVAAAAAFFLGGAAFERTRSAAEPETPGMERPPAAAVAPPAAAVQEAGTGYVTAIARVAEQASRLPPAEVQAAREVAYAALFGATYELASMGPGDPALERLLAQTRGAWLSAPPAESGG